MGEPIKDTTQQAQSTVAPSMDEQLQQMDDVQKEKNGQDVDWSNYGLGTFSENRFGVEETEDLIEGGYDSQSMLQESFDADKALYEAQGGFEQAWNVVAGGVARGALSFFEYASYLSDADDFVGEFREFDETAKSQSGEVKNIADFREYLREGKDAISKATPIRSQETNDFGWWMQGMQSLVESTVAFGPLGGGVAGASRGIAKGVIGAMGKTGAKSALKAEIGSRLFAAAASNYVESMSMADEMYTNIYNEATSNGVDEETAAKIAKEKSNEFILKNKINIIPELLMFGKSLGGGLLGTLGDAAQLGKFQRARRIGKDVIAEGWEETSAGYMAHSGEQDAGEELGLRSKKSFADRAGEYMGNGGLEDLVFGMMGGPFQGAVMRGVGKTNDLVFNKNYDQDPGNFKEAPITKPEFERPKKDVPNPGAYSEWLKKEGNAPEGVDAQTVNDVASGKKEDTRFDKAKAEYDAEVKAFEENESQKTAWDDYAKHEKRKADHAKGKTAYDQKQKVKDTGKIDQTIKDVQEALTTDAKRDADYKAAMLAGEFEKADNIANERFEDMVLRYAKRNALTGKNQGSLEYQLNEAIGDESLSDLERETAKKFQSRVKGLAETYSKVTALHGDSALADTAYRTKVRASYNKELLKEYDAKLAQQRIELVEDMRTSLSKDLSDIELEFIQLRKELDTARASSAETTDDKNINAHIEAKRQERIKALEKRLNELDETYKEESKSSKAEYKANKDLFAEFEKTINDRESVWTSYQAYNKASNTLMSDSFKKNNRKTMITQLNDAIDSAENSQDIEIVKVGLAQGINSGFLRKRDLRKITDAIISKEDEIAENVMKAEDRLKKMERSIGEARSELGNVSSTAIEMELSILEQEYADMLRQEEILPSQILKLRTKLNEKSLKKASKRSREKRMKIEEELMKLESQLPTQSNKDITQYGISVKKSQLERLRNIEDLERQYQEVQDAMNTVYGNLQREYDNILEKIDKGSYVPRDKVLRAKLASKGKVTETLSDAESKMKNAERANESIPKKAPVTHSVNKDSETEGAPEPSGTNESFTKTASEPNNISYISHTDNYNPNAAKLSLTDWIETNRESDKTGTVLQFGFDMTDLDNDFVSEIGKEALRKINSKETLNPKEIAALPIRIYALDPNGDKLELDGNQVFGWMKESHPDRKTLVDGFMDSVTYTTSVSAIGNGVFKTTKDSGDPRTRTDEKGSEMTLTIYDGAQHLTHKKAGKRRAAKTSASGTSGFLYKMETAPNGEKIPIRMNSRKLNQPEVDIIYDIIYDVIVNGSSWDSLMGDDFKGLTYHQVVNMLVLEDNKSLVGEFPFWVDTKNKQLFVGDAFKPIDFKGKNRAGIMKNNEADIKNALKVMWRTARIDLINQPMKDFKPASFKWFGKTIQPSISYNDFMMDEGAITTNGAYYNGRPFVGPSISFGAKATWKSDKMSDNLTPNQAEVSDDTQKAQEELKPTTTQPTTVDLVANNPKKGEDGWNEGVIAIEDGYAKIPLFDVEVTSPEFGKHTFSAYVNPDDNTFRIIEKSTGTSITPETPTLEMGVAILNTKLAPGKYESFKQNILSRPVVNEVELKENVVVETKDIIEADDEIDDIFVRAIPIQDEVVTTKDKTDDMVNEAVADKVNESEQESKKYEKRLTSRVKSGTLRTRAQKIMHLKKKGIPLEDLKSLTDEELDNRLEC